MSIRIPFLGGRGKHRSSVQVLVHSATDVGLRRTNNEDNYIALTGKESPEGTDAVMVVADGMGGHTAGEVASTMAVRNIVRHLTSQPSEKTLPIDGYPELLRQILNHVNAEVFKAGQENERRGMGTTCTVAIVIGTQVHLAHVGDSRAYLLREGRLVQLTSDHSWVAEQVEAGSLSPEQARSHPNKNVLTRAMGVKPDVGVEAKTLDVRKGDHLLLCSDGLHSLVEDGEILEMLESNRLKQAAVLLIDRAKKAGGDDNITLVIGEVVGRTGR